MKTLILSLCLFPVLASAETFTLTSNQSGLQYQCSGGANPNPPGADPSCVSKLSDYCNRNTGFSSSQCFDKASTNCRGSSFKYPDCVVQTAEYCNRNTGYSSSQCFDRALEACRGSAPAITELMSGAALKAVK